MSAAMTCEWRPAFGLVSENGRHERKRLSSPLAELGLDWQSITDITGHETTAVAREYIEKRR
jgi:hypothetical protein